MNRIKDDLPERAVRGRGTRVNPAGRFEERETVPFHDTWEDPEDDPPPLRTNVHPLSIRTIITSNDSPDIPFERSINPYKGCEHGCVYCFARPTHEYMGLSSGLDFETEIFSKPDAPAVLERALARRGYRVSTLALGANTDPYQPVERRLRLTRGILEVLSRHRHPVAIVTKGELIARDIDLLGPMAAQRLARVFVSITTLDHELARKMEPRAASPRRRLRTIEKLTKAGIPVGVLASPMIPGLNDHELERILEQAHARGAVGAGTVLLRLPYQLGALFEGWLQTHYPHRANKVLGLMRSCRDGKLYDSAHGTRMRGTGPYADLLQHRFRVALKRLGLATGRPPLDCTKFTPPKETRRSKQLPLFG